MDFLRCSWPDCDSPAEVTRREVLESTDGPVEHIGTMCLSRHVLFMPVDHMERFNEIQDRKDTGQTQT